MTGTSILDGKRARRIALSSMVVLADDELTAYRADLRMQVADWQADLAWIDVQIAADAMAA